MRNRDEDLDRNITSSDRKNINNSNLDSESSRRSGSGSFDSSGRRGEMEDRSEVSREEKSPGRGNVGNIDSSEGRH